jgi:hypothetical protein
LPPKDLHDAKRSVLTIGVDAPQVIATRRRHAVGTLTVTEAPLRTATPHLAKYFHELTPDVAARWMRAGGTDATPSTTRLPSSDPEPAWPITSPQATMVLAAGSAATADIVADAAQAIATVSAAKPDLCITEPTVRR